MNPNLINSKRNWRVASSVSLLLVLCFGLVQVLGQFKTPRRITAIFVSAGTEGARVSIISDSQLSDSEAFRRGERFYVRIPMADFAATQPTFHGDGFEDVQVQKVGDSVVVSFKLEVGASARVNESGNQLQVLFSSPTAIARNNKGVRSRTTAMSGRAGSRGLDAAGPMPPDSPEIVGTANEATPADGTAADPWKHSSKARSNGLATTTVAAENKANQNSQPSPTPYSYASPAGTPWTSYPASATSTPFASPVPTTSTTSFKVRAENLVQSITTNRVAAIAAVVVLVAFGALAVVMFRRRGTKVVRAKKRSRVPRVEPNESTEAAANNWSDLNEDILFDEAFDFQEPQTETTVGGAEPVQVSSIASDEFWAASHPAVTPVSAGVFGGRDEQEREVFEL